MAKVELRAVHFLYPFDIIGVIFHHHRVAPPRERRTASTPASWRSVRFQVPGEPSWATARGLAWNVYLHGAGISTRGGRQRGGRRASDDAYREGAHGVAVGCGGRLAGRQPDGGVGAGWALAAPHRPRGTGVRAGRLCGGGAAVPGGAPTRGCREPGAQLHVSGRRL